MVEDVRLKVRMRLKALIDSLARERRTDSRIDARVREARRSDDASKALKVEWRGRVCREFPGCDVRITPLRISVRLPPGYPGWHVPISEVYPHVLVDVFCPPQPPGF